MKTRMTLVALMTVTLIGSSVGTGHAGGGGQGGPGGIFLFQCYGIEDGANAPQILSIDDQFTNATRERVGRLRLVCAPADFSVVNEDVAPVQVVDGADHLTCYGVSGADPKRSVVTLIDAFGQQTVKVDDTSRFVCVLAAKQCLKGCPVITETP
jgi:hypothetical protein